MRKHFFKVLIILLTVFFFKSGYPATFQVTTTADRNNGSCNAGDCSLREAVRAANANPNEAHIILLKSGTTYSLTISGEDDTAEKGDLDLIGNITIKPDGSAVATIDAGGKTGMKDRVFHILKDSNVNLSNLLIQNGFLSNFLVPNVDPNKLDPNKIDTLIADSLPWGAGIHNSGNLTLNQVTVQNNTGSPVNKVTMLPEPGISVGISNDATGKLTLNNSLITNHSGEMGAVGIVNVKGELILNDSQVTNNIGLGATNANGQIEMGIGVGIGGLFGKITLNNTLVSKNNGNSTATGIATAWTDLLIDKSTISENNAIDKNNVKSLTSSMGVGSVKGNVTIKNSKIMNHQGSLTDSSDVYGFSYLNFSPNKQPINTTVVIQNTEFIGNKANRDCNPVNDGFTKASDQGKTSWQLSDLTISGNESLNTIAISSSRDVGSSDMQLQRLNISKNRAQNGFEGVHASNKNSKFFLDSILITDNSGRFFAGVSANSGTIVTLRNSTISNNLVNDPNGFGAGVENNFGGKIDILFSTIVSNKVVQNGNKSFGVNILAGSGTVRLFGTILSDHFKNCSGVEFASNGFNLSNDDSCTFFDAAKNDLAKTDPVLSPLTDNGGFTPTNALLDTSPALNKIPEASCKDFDGNLVLVDQRGVIRPAGAACDIGAFEKATIVVSLNNQTLRFPDTRVGESSPTQELILTNQEDAIQVSSSRLLGDHPEGFSVVDDQCSSKTLKKGETCSLKIQFNPKSEGEQTGVLQLTIPANIAQSTVNLSGKALAVNNSITPAGGNGGGGGCALSSEVSTGRIGFLFAIMTGFILVGFRRAKQNLK